MDDKTAYKEALERARNYFESPRTCFDIDALTDIFPELKESDEKIRGAIIDHLKDNNLTEWAAWLEKQGEHSIACSEEQMKVLNEVLTFAANHESPYWNDYIFETLNNLIRQLKKLENQDEQKPADKIEPKFKVGDWITDGQLTCKVLSITGKSYELHLYNDDYCHFETDVQSVDKYYHLWTIQDAKDGDVLHASSFSSDCIFVFDRLDKWKFDEPNGDRVVATGHCCLTLSADNMEFGIQGPDCIEVDTVKPATKIQRDLLFQKIHEAGYIFDFERKELQKIHVIDEKASPTCNEEDEEYNGEDYGIDSLYHAQRILEKTLGEVDGYQSDDGILEHKCAISAVKKLYEHKPTECIKFNNEFENQISHLIASVLNGEHEYNEGFVKYVAQSLLSYAKNELKPTEWTEEDEKRVNRISDFIWKNRKGDTNEIYQQEQDVNWIKSIKDRVQTKEWTEEDESMYTRTLGILGKCYMGQLPTKVEAELKWLKSLNTQKNLKQICNSVDLSKIENKALKLLYNELLEKFKGEHIKVTI